MQPPIVREIVDAPPLFASASVPNMLMVWWAAGLMALMLMWAIRSFEHRSL
jgi:hypothetical protein